jgi:hypothetical protein
MEGRRRRRGNISIINNYRSQFDRVISSSSYDELVKRLRDKAG